MRAGPIRLLISDIDGTLVRHDKSLPEENVAAIKDAMAQPVGKLANKLDW